MRKKRNNLLTALAVCLAFMTAAFAWCFGLNTGLSTYAAETADHGIRFKQIAAGEDFAIALTYDNQLYGWSLRSGSYTPWQDSARSLGEYYSAVPTQIPVTFINGPRTTGATIDWSNEAVYHRDYTGNDRIASIAATRTTAAFITEDGFIYTWGVDTASLRDAFYGNNIDGSNYLLLRPSTNITANVSKTLPHAMKPYMINYYDDASGVYYSTFGTKHLIPATTSYAGAYGATYKSQFELTSSEYNYVVSYHNTTGANQYNYFVWGSSLYGQTGASYPSPYINAYSSYNNLNIINYTEGNTRYELLAGGRTIGLLSDSAPVNHTNLYVRGKNFYVPQNKEFTVTGDVNYDTVSGYNTYGGENGSSVDSHLRIYAAEGDSNPSVVITNGLASGGNTGTSIGKNFLNQAKGQVADRFTAFETVNFGDADETSITGLTAKTPTVSLGNDFGYGIVSGNVYFWGDNSFAQNGSGTAGAGTSSPLLLDGTGRWGAAAVRSVVAGQNVSKVSITENYISTAYFDVYSKGSSSAIVKDEYVNDNIFITGLLTTNNRVWVWNKDAAATDITTLFQAYGVGTGPNNHVAALFKGYGNNLFAISNLGKIFRIVHDGADFTVIAYDQFNAAANNAITNWSTDTRSNANLITFTKSNQRTANQAPTSYAVNAVARRNGITLNGADNGIKVNGGDAATYNPLIKTDNIGDAYRILRPDEGATPFDSTRSYIYGQSLDPTVSFYWNDSDTPITAVELNKYLVWSFTGTGNTADYGLQFAPLQSTMGKTITVKLYLARYDTVANVNSNVLYDHNEAYLKINILNTPAVYNLTQFIGTNTADAANATVPLLDPNNDYNKQYSIAAMNVTGGFDALLDFLYIDPASTDAVAFRDALNTNAASEDEGFPGRNKIVPGQLNYYGVQAYYDDIYRYMATDRDGNIVEIADPDTTAPLTGNVNYVARTVTLSVPIAGANAARLSALDTEFNNLYGFKTLSVNGSNLTLSYQVLTLTAVKSTNTVVYTNNNISSINTSQEISTATAGSIVYNAVEKEIDGNPNNETVIDGRVKQLPIHSQSSLVLKDPENNAPVYGISGNEVINVTNRELKVGESKTYSLSEYVYSINGYDASAMVFANAVTKDGSTTYRGEDNYNAFNNLFKPAGVVTLTGNSLTFAPKTTDEINLEVQVKRFLPRDITTPFMNNVETVNFIFKIQPVAATFALKPANDPDAPRTISISGRETVIDVARRFNCTPSVLQLSSALIISNSNVIEASVDEVNKTITVTPKQSGKSNLTYTVSQYGQTIKETIALDVIGRTVNSTEIKIDDFAKLQVSVILTALIDQNRPVRPSIIGDNYTINEDNLDFWFEDRATGERLKNEDGENYKEVDGKRIVPLPAFLKKVSLEVEEGSGWHFRFELNNEQVSGDKSYRFVVAAYPLSGPTATNGLLYQQNIASSRLSVLDGNEEMLLSINTKESVTGGTYEIKSTGKGKNYKLEIPTYFLTRHAGSSEGIANPQEYNITIVIADLGAGEYFTYQIEPKRLIIIPIKNTEDYLNVSVSVAYGSSSYVLTFKVEISGIVETLTKEEYTLYFMVGFFSTLGLLIVIFVIRMLIYFRKRAEQRRIIKKNQMLIKMRDKMHNRTASATREEYVKTKLKMEDPKYAKMFNDVRKEKELESGITLDNSIIADKAEKKAAASTKASKKKKGKKSIEDLKAELEAKKAAFAQMQTGGQMTMDEGVFDSNDYSGELTREDVENQIKAKINSDDIDFDIN